ncbi:MAG: hypothetical protein ONB48_07445 [candidate division KSB1 bacterium]|nr:hypothetical protein [candidate division KSB1 bacterium]MDZ7274655.1 hypothetical protein [candidate division KSB1 bacterium]MDZ7285480.1 hypothetical protein [candidate division KSB1 bacterium]MDZ7298512.1 hypothetical protein [candidate division KSB1 bacterium]MDZ7306264.1 hypothetical protein [candidate division KSB1 bacterium]
MHRKLSAGRRLLPPFVTAAVMLALLPALALSQSSGRKLSAIRIPPGVTPLTAAQADSLARQLFVPWPQAQEAERLVATAQLALSRADSVWAILQRAAEHPPQVTLEDSLAAVRATFEGGQKLQKSVPLIQKYLQTQQETVRQQAIAYLQAAEKAFVQALQLNPFATQARTWLATVYRLLGDRFKDREDYGRAINIWETLVRLEPGVYSHYFNLAQTYFAVQAWQKSLENFEACEQRLLASAAVADSRIANPAQPVAAAIDSNVLFLSVLYQSLSAIRLVNEEKTYASLRRALTLATTPAQQRTVTEYLKWMDWDDGNIPATMQRDSALAYAGRGDFPAAAKTFAGLLPRLRTSRARNEIGWRLALIEFTNLNQKEAAAERLLNIVTSIPTDVQGAPPDSLSRLYFDNYGTMCLSLGNEKIAVDRQLAYTYYLQAASFNWSGRGKSYFALATLADADPRLAVADAERAYALRHQLDAEEVINLHKLLIRGYRRLQQFDKARQHFEELQRLLAGNSGSPPGL